MPLRSLPILAASSIFLATFSVAKAATASDLDAAFQATFGQPAPIVRHVEQPLFEVNQPDKAVEHLSLEMELKPDRLVPIDGSRQALIIKEKAKDVGQSTQGAIAVSYLRHSHSGWTLEHLWPEIDYNGVFGEPANAGEDVRRFGSAPLYLATTEWCGMGGCSDTISVISLAPSGARDLGGILGGAQYSAKAAFPDTHTGFCEDYAYTAEIGAPQTASGIFSITYHGWTAPPTALTPKIRFHRTADAVPDGISLILRPKVRVPDCGR